MTDKPDVPVAHAKPRTPHEKLVRLGADAKVAVDRGTAPLRRPIGRADVIMTIVVCSILIVVMAIYESLKR